MNVNMTYLLTWNPEQRHSDGTLVWEDYEKDVAKFQKGNTVKIGWSCGNRKSMDTNSRVFFLRQGNDRPGLIGSGRVTTTPHEEVSFRNPTETAWYVEVDIDFLLPLEKRLPRDQLLKGILPLGLVNARASGYEIGKNLAIKLEKEWKIYTKSIKLVASVSSTIQSERVRIEGEKRASETTVRDPQLRADAKAEYGLKCCCCGFEFSLFYGDIAKNCAIVHHLSMFKGKRRKATVQDVRVVCANCHQVIHIRKKPMAVEDLKQEISTRWTCWSEKGIKPNPSLNHL